MSETLPLAEVRDHLSKVLSRVERYHERIVVTRNGREVAVVLSPDDLASLEETLEALADPDLTAQLGERLTPAVALTEAEARQRWARQR